MKFQLYTFVTFFLGTSCFQTDDFHIQGLNALRKTVNEFKSAHQGRLRMGNDDPTVSCSYRFKNDKVFLN